MLFQFSIPVPIFSFQQPHSCDTFPVLCSVAFQSSFNRRLLLELDPYGGNDLDGMFPLFYKQVARELAAKLAIIVRHLVQKGSFPACWRLTDGVPVHWLIIYKLFEQLHGWKVCSIGLLSCI